MSFRISRMPVEYYPSTGESFRANPIPDLAKERRGQGPSMQNPLRAAGLAPVDYGQVLDIPEDALSYYANIWGLGKLLTTNEKTKKPRKKSNRKGLIEGLALMPHYYPNLLDDVDTDDSGQLSQVEIVRFNAFRGRNAGEASADSGVPQQNLLTFCTKSSSFCRASCLVLTGNNPKAKANSTAKARKSYALLENPEVFIALLREELIAFASSALSKDLDPVVRLNMLSDIPWYELCPELLIECAEEYGIVWYDYTKVPFWNNPKYQEVSDILDLTFSFSGANHKECTEALNAGHRVAMCFAPANPERAAGPDTRTSFGEVYGLGRKSGLIDKHGRISLLDGSWDFVDGDSSDYRIDDPEPSIVCLNFKEPSVGRYDPHYKALWESIPVSREKFSWQMEDPERLGEIYAKALRNNSFAKHMAEKVDAPASVLADKPSMKQFLQTFEFDEVVDEFLAFTGKSPERMLTILDQEAVRSVRDARAQAAELASLTPEEYQELRERRAAQRRRQHAARKEKVSVAMFPVENTELLVGPHVPTILED